MAQNNFDNFKSDIDRLVERLLDNIAMAMLSYIDSSDVIPIDTHNLKDSTGIGVYRNGVLKKLLMPRRAQEARIIGGIAVWGEDMIDQYLEAGVSRYNNGNYIVLMSAMPYAEEVDTSENRYGYFTDILTYKFEEIVDEITRLYGRN